MRMALIGSIPTGGIRVCQDQVGTGKQHRSEFARHANTVIAAIEPAVAKCRRICAMAVRKIRSAGAISGQVPPDHVGRGIHLGRLALLGHRAEHIRAEVMARYASGFLNGKAVRCGNTPGPAAPLAHCLGRNPKSPGKRSLAPFHTTNCMLDSVHCANVKHRFTARQAMLSTARRIDVGRSSYA